MFFTLPTAMSGLSTAIPGPQNISLYVETCGSPDAERATLFVHGGFQSLRCFRHQFARLSEQAFVIALDLPYHGYSNPVPESVQPTPALWAESVQSVLVHLHRQETPTVIVAWSFGGLVTRHYLFTYGLHHIEGLVLVGSLFGGMDAYQQFQEPAITQIVLTKLSGQIAFPERFKAFEQFVAMLTKRTLPPDEFYAQYGYNVKTFLHSLPVAEHWLDEMPCNLPSFLQQFTFPVLLIQGADDALVPPAYTRHLARLLPQAQLLEYEHCGHAPFLEVPERFNRDVVRYLSATLQQKAPR